MQMPGMDGLELGHAIRAARDLGPIRLVMLTSIGLRGMAEESRKAGFSGPYTMIFDGPGDEWSSLEMIQEEIRPYL